MSGRSSFAATRSLLLRARRRLDYVERGALLLTRKRQALVDELFARARTAVASREAIDDASRQAWHALWVALAAEGRDAIAPDGWPTRELDVDLAVFELWGMRVARLGQRPAVVRSLAARGAIATSRTASARHAAVQFETLVERLIDAAPQEQLMRRLGQALARTTRLVNTLERRLAVDLRAEIVAIARTLDEREREEHVRMKRLTARRQSDARAAGV